MIGLNVFCLVVPLEKQKTSGRRGKKKRKTSLKGWGTQKKRGSEQERREGEKLNHITPPWDQNWTFRCISIHFSSFPLKKDTPPCSAEHEHKLKFNRVQKGRSQSKNSEKRRLGRGPSVLLMRGQGKMNSVGLRGTPFLPAPPLQVYGVGLIHTPHSSPPAAHSAGGSGCLGVIAKFGTQTPTQGKQASEEWGNSQERTTLQTGSQGELASWSWSSMQKVHTTRQAGLLPRVPGWHKASAQGSSSPPPPRQQTGIANWGARFSVKN